MAKYQYRALGPSGSPVAGVLDAISATDAIATLRKGGMRPIVVEPQRAHAARTRRGAEKKARRLITNFFAEMGVLLQAGLPLDRALAIAVDNVSQHELKARLGEVLVAVREGKPLSAAMEAQGSLFPPLAPAMTEAGEANGRLGDALTRLATMLEQADDQRRQIIGAMTYPAALALISLGVVLLMLLFVIPQFEPLFASAPPGALPASSRAIMGASRFVRHNGPIILATIGLAGLFAWRSLTSPGGKARFDRQILSVPGIGPLLRAIETARFARSLGALIEGGVPLPTALALARRTVANRWMNAGLGEVVEHVRQGSGLAAPLGERTLLPPLALSFIRTGEETSELGPMLGRLANVLERDIKAGLDRTIAVATPVIVVGLGAGVAAMVASIMSAILGFNDLAIAR